MTPPEGLLVVDKPSGMTSHDVVAQVRRWAGTRRVGHGGTLDPMATGVLVLGIGRASRLLGKLIEQEKEYDATIRLGIGTTTDDAEGEELSRTDAGDVTDAAIRASMAALTGPIEQVPSAVSAVKVDGERAYRRVRRGETVDLAARPVHVRAFELLHRDGDDLGVHVECSSGTYVRALARDVGTALGVGAHLTALRRTRVGPFAVDDAVPLDRLLASDHASVLPLAAAAGLLFSRIDVDVAVGRRLGQGQRVPIADIGLTHVDADRVAVFDSDEGLVALADVRDGVLRPVTVFASVG